MRVDFSRWKDGDPTEWILHTERYFRFNKTPKESMVDITIIHLKVESSGMTGLSIHMAHLHGGNSNTNC
ncbi:hypothetical protein BHE74_00055832 [Ensete ventricosum]|nr:hypothetical protein BHE74_00055832 [Ensete ventricosum]